MNRRPGTLAVSKLSKTKEALGFTLIELMIVIAILGVLIAILLPSFQRARSQGVLTACQSNLKNIATAVELYSVDNEHKYPVSLSDIVPKYFVRIPSCPTPSIDTYSSSYTSGTGPDLYTLYCNGLFHTGSGITAAGYPQYLSGQGSRMP
jgi:prepilin-type N-terminal cleavage/methylation domain-containing protein